MRKTIVVFWAIFFTNVAFAKFIVKPRMFPFWKENERM